MWWAYYRPSEEALYLDEARLLLRGEETMITGDYDFLKNLASLNVCAQHKTELVVAWHGKERTWVLRCGLDHHPDAITRQPSLAGLYRQGEELPGHIEDKVKKGIRRRTMQPSKHPRVNEFAMVPQTDLGTGELLLPEVIKALVDYALKYHLDPVRGHVVLMYSKPYITIDGYLYHANRSRVPYTLQSRPMTTLELDQYKIGVTDHGWLSKVILTDTSDEFTGTGIVTYEEMTAKSVRDASKLRSPVVAAHPWQLAQKRAEWQALRRAFPIGETEEKKED